MHAYSAQKCYNPVSNGTMTERLAGLAKDLNFLALPNALEFIAFSQGGIKAGGRLGYA
jgi:hypothetical protein